MANRRPGELIYVPARPRSLGWLLFRLALGVGLVVLYAVWLDWGNDISERVERLERAVEGAGP